VGVSIIGIVEHWFVVYDRCWIDLMLHVDVF